MPDFTLVVVEGSYASGVTAAVDMLSAARELAKAAQAPIPTWRIASVQGGCVPLEPGITVDSGVLSPGRDDHSLWIVPAIAAASEAELRASPHQARWVQLAGLLQQHLRGGGRVAACASSVLLLNQGGALAGRRVTTAWWLAPALQWAAPGATVDSDRTLCVDGPVTTCGPTFAQPELMLHLIGQLCGPRLAEKLSLLWLRNGGAAHPAADLLRSFVARDELVARIVETIESGFPESPSVAGLAAKLAVSERTLSRHVRRVTGKSTIALVQDVKLRRARALLERSRMSVDEVAAAVGYSDSTALRRLMKKVTGAQPSRYRAAGLHA